MQPWVYLSWQGSLIVCSWWIGVVNDVICLLALALWQYFELAYRMTNRKYWINRLLLTSMTYILVVGNGLLLLLEAFKHVQTSTMILSGIEAVILITTVWLAYHMNRWLPFHYTKLIWMTIILLGLLLMDLQHIPIMVDVVLGASVVVYLLYRCHSWVIADLPR